MDGIHAATTATANKLLALDGSAKLPASITGDADTVDGIHAASLVARDSHTGTQAGETISGGKLGDTKVVLARMMSGEYLATGSGDLTLNLGTVTVGARILLTGYCHSTNSVQFAAWQNSGSGSATIDFAGAAILKTNTPASELDDVAVGGICRVLTGGTLVLALDVAGSGTLSTYAHAMVLIND
mgnify:FL=1